MTATLRKGVGPEMSRRTPHRHVMVGTVPFKVRMLPRPRALGYREVMLTAGCLLGPMEDAFEGMNSTTRRLSRNRRNRGSISSPPEAAVSSSGRTTPSVLLASFLLHFVSNPEVARHFVDCCRRFKEDQ